MYLFSLASVSQIAKAHQISNSPPGSLEKSGWVDLPQSPRKWKCCCSLNKHLESGCILLRLSITGSGTMATAPLKGKLVCWCQATQIPKPESALSALPC